MATFHPFPKLPIELRLEIWKIAAEDTPDRVIKFGTPLPEFLDMVASYENTSNGGTSLGLEDHIQSIVEARNQQPMVVTHPGVPALLHVNPEARAYAKVYYEPGFITFFSLPISGGEPKMSTPLFFCAQDLFFLVDGIIWENIMNMGCVDGGGNTDFTKVRNIAVGGWEDFNPWIEEFENLDNLILERADEASVHETIEEEPDWYDPELTIEEMWDIGTEESFRNEWEKENLAYQPKKMSFMYREDMQRLGENNQYKTSLQM